MARVKGSPFCNLVLYLTGTVVKHKKGKFLADLANPGEEVLVVRGGKGGVRNVLISNIALNA